MTIPPVPDPTFRHAPRTVAGADESSVRAVARDLEAAFLAEMLKHAGLGAPRGMMGGGIGEDQFASLMREEHARALADRGGIGLAESMFEALVARSDGAAP